MGLVQQGNSQAFQTLFSRYKDPIWSFVYRRVRDRNVTADVYQEVFLRVWKSANTYKSGQKVKPWLYRISTNVMRDQYRKSTRQVFTVELDDLSPGQITDPIGTTDVERAIQSLPDNLRDAFLLGAVQGLDHNEVAEALDISSANARARLSRARLRLREILSNGEDA
jgi:RNA polymerase sigma-70 factor (ECF subfamily)